MPSIRPLFSRIRRNTDGMQTAEMVAAAGMAMAILIAFFLITASRSGEVLCNLGDSVAGAEAAECTGATVSGPAPVGGAFPPPPTAVPIEPIAPPAPADPCPDGMFDPADAPPGTSSDCLNIP